jgi:hypothetical protein
MQVLHLGLLMRTLFGFGTPRGLQGRVAVFRALLSTFWSFVFEAIAPIETQIRIKMPFLRVITASTARG